MFKTARYLAIILVILLLERHKSLCKSIDAEGKTALVITKSNADDDDDYDYWDYFGIFDYISSLFYYDYDSSVEDKSFIICQNCTVEVKQRNDSSDDKWNLMESATPPKPLSTPLPSLQQEPTSQSRPPSTSPPLSLPSTTPLPPTQSLPPPLSTTPPPIATETPSEPPPIAPESG